MVAIRFPGHLGSQISHGFMAKTPLIDVARLSHSINSKGLNNVYNPHLIRNNTQIRSMYSFQGPKAVEIAVLDDGSKVIKRNDVITLDPSQKPSEIYPPAQIVPNNTPKYNIAKISKEISKQIITLRQQNPDVNTVDSLSARFNLHPRQIMAIVRAPKQRAKHVHDLEKERLESASSKNKLKLLMRIKKKQNWK